MTALDWANLVLVKTAGPALMYTLRFGGDVCSVRVAIRNDSISPSWADYFADLRIDGGYGDDLRVFRDACGFEATRD